MLLGAGAWLDRWEEHSLPGARPVAEGPRFRATWPPRLFWEEIRWETESGDRLRAGQLDVEIDPRALLRGRVGIRSIEIEDARFRPRGADVGGTPLAGRVDSILRVTAWGEDLPVPPPGGWEGSPGEARILVRSLAVDPEGPRIDRIEGWGATPSRGAWTLRVVATPSAGYRLPLRIEGSGGGGTGRIEASSDFGPGRALRLRHETGPPDRWFLSGTDDGALLLAALGLLEEAGRGLLRGPVAYAFEGPAIADLSGEISLDRIVLGDGVSPWRIDGWICLDGGVLSLERLVLSSGEDRLSIAGSLSASALRSIGDLRVDGAVRGAPLLGRVGLEREEGRRSLRIRELSWGGAHAGPGSLLVLPPANAGADWRARGRIGIGAGAIEVEAPAAGGGYRVAAAGAPLEGLLPWLPVRLPGRWQGRIDGEAHLTPPPAGWSAEGTLRAASLRLDRLPILEGIESLTGKDGAIEFVDLSAGWEVREGSWRVDSLSGGLRETSVSGSIIGFGPDSILGLLRLRPEPGSASERILRLIGGGRGDLALGIEGRGEAVELLPLDADDARAWRQRIERLGSPARRFSGGIGPRRGSGSSR